MTSDTPRTDAAIERGECGPDFARTLERELTEAREQEMMKAQQCSAERLRANAAEKELAALRARLASTEVAPPRGEEVAQIIERLRTFGRGALLEKDAASMLEQLWREKEELARLLSKNEWPTTDPSAG